MTWLVIIGVLIIVGFGPLMWLRPSKKDRRLAALRERARAIGFALTVKPLPLLAPAPEERVSAGGKTRDATELVAVYEWLLARRIPGLEGFRLLRGPAPEQLGRGAVEVASGWYLDPEQTFPPARWAHVGPTLLTALEDLPADVAAVALEARQVALYWRESAGNDASEVDRLKQWSTTLEAALQDDLSPSEGGPEDGAPSDLP